MVSNGLLQQPEGLCALGPDVSARVSQSHPDADRGFWFFTVRPKDASNVKMERTWKNGQFQV